MTNPMDANLYAQAVNTCYSIDDLAGTGIPLDAYLVDMPSFGAMSQVAGGDTVIVNINQPPAAAPVQSAYPQAVYPQVAYSATPVYPTAVPTWSGNGLASVPISNAVLQTLADIGSKMATVYQLALEAIQSATAAQAAQAAAQQEASVQASQANDSQDTDEADESDAADQEDEVDETDEAEETEESESEDEESAESVQVSVRELSDALTNLKDNFDRYNTDEEHTDELSKEEIEAAATAYGWNDDVKNYVLNHINVLGNANGDSNDGENLNRNDLDYLVAELEDGKTALPNLKNNDGMPGQAKLGTVFRKLRDGWDLYNDNGGGNHLTVTEIRALLDNEGAARNLDLDEETVAFIEANIGLLGNLNGDSNDNKQGLTKNDLEYLANLYGGGS